MRADKYKLPGKGSRKVEMLNTLLTKGAGKRLHRAVVRRPGLESERVGTVQSGVCDLGEITEPSL